MPTVLRVGGFAFSIFAGDHNPPHVHVRYGGAKCRIVLETLQVKKETMKAADRGAALKIVAAHRAELSAAWETVRARRGEGR